MKAIRYTRLGGPEVLELADVPTPKPKPGEVRVRLAFASVNFGDIHFRRGIPGIPTPLPKIPGFDGSGIVDELGDGGTTPSVGTRVVIYPALSCGNCDRCSSGRLTECTGHRVVGRETDGTYAEFVCVPAVNAISLPESIDLKMAAAIPVTHLTAWNMVITKARVRPGQTVLVTAAGSSVSTAAIQIAKLRGARVLAAASTEDKAQKAVQLLGADEGFTYDQISRKARAATGGQGVDVVLDHVGGSLWNSLLKATRNGGTIVTCGATDGFDPTADLRHVFFRQLRILGSTLGNLGEFSELLQLVAEKKIRAVIDEVYPIEKAAEAHQKVESREIFGKVLLDCSLLGL